MRFYRISWEEFAKLTIELAHRLAGELVWGVPRGGRLVSAFMAYHGCRHTISLFMHDTIVVDDICDSGETLAGFYNYKATAALIVRQSCIGYPTHYAKVLDTNAYILFPYEDEEEVQKQNSYKTNG